MINEEALKKLLKGKSMEELGKSWNNRENSLGASDTDASDVEDIGRDKVESLKDAIKETNELIESRKKLSKEVIMEADSIKSEVNNFLSAVHLDRRLDDPLVIRDQIALKQKQVEVSELQLKEKISCWQDVAQLKKDLRENKRELKDRESRIDMLNKILE